MDVYRFPPNRKALEATRYQMAAKLVEECAEVVQAIADNARAPEVLQELADVVHVVEGLQRAYGNDNAVMGSYGAVLSKCRNRGDYEL